MVGWRKHTVCANGGTVAARGLGWWAGRTQQREQAEADAELIRDLRWQWRSVCAARLMPLRIASSTPCSDVPTISVTR